MKRFQAILIAQAKIALRNRSAVFWNLVFPVGYLALFGYIYRNSGRITLGYGSAATSNYAGYLMVGVILMNTLSVSIMGTAPLLANWREQGLLRRIRATPVPTWEFLLAFVVVKLVQVAAGSALAVGLAIFAFDVRPVADGLWLALPVFALSVLGFLALGLILAAVARRAETVQASAQVVFFALLFASGIFIPSEVFPEAARAILHWTPVTLTLDVLRPALLAGEVGGTSVLYTGLLALYAVAALGIASRLFRWEEV
jgi:ABC-2 type transport system permease protein